MEIIYKRPFLYFLWSRQLFPFLLRYLPQDLQRKEKKNFFSALRMCFYWPSILSNGNMYSLFCISFLGLRPTLIIINNQNLINCHTCCLFYVLPSVSTLKHKWSTCSEKKHFPFLISRAFRGKEQENLRLAQNCAPQQRESHFACCSESFTANCALWEFGHKRRNHSLATRLWTSAWHRGLHAWFLSPWMGWHTVDRKLHQSSY